MTGLRGLPGLNRLSEEERQAFMLANEDQLKQFRRPGDRKRAAEIMYNNQLFVNKFGEDKFNSLGANTEDAYNLRNEYLRNTVIEDEWNKRFNPIKSNGLRDNKIGLGDMWEHYNEMSTDAKLKVLESDYRNNSDIDKSIDEFGNKNIFNRAAMGLLDLVGLDEALKEHKKGVNSKIIESIYNDDVEERTKSLSSEIAQAYMDPAISSLSDDEVKKAFIKAITPGSYIDERGLPNRGIAEYAAQYGDGTGDLHDLDNFTIDDMRQVLAKKAVYDKYMSPDMAATALNNEAKRYIKEQQSTLERVGKFFNDVKISTASYIADKANGIWNLALMAEDKLGDKPIVWVDDTGNVVHPNEQKFVRTNDGGYGYYDEEQNFHPVHKAQIARTTLRNMGKDTDGSKLDSWMDPVFWTKAEQFGTMDEEKQAQYEKLGTSPYKVMWDPNEDSNIWYEAFKMMSFGIGDAITMLIPFGVGATGKALSAASKAGKVTRGLGNLMQKAGRGLTYETKFGQVAQGTAGALGIAYAYQRGSFQETLAGNLQKAEETVFEASKKDVIGRYETDEDYRNQVDSLIKARASEIKSDYLSQAQKDGTPIQDMESLDASIMEKAKEEVLGNLTQKRFAERKSSDEYAKLEDEAINSAGDTAVNTFFPEAIKYGLVNNLGYRKFLYRNPAGFARRVSPNLKGLTEKEINGAKRLTLENSRFATRAQKMKEFGKVLRNQAWGGAWTNGTDDMMVDGAERINADSYDRYLHDYATGESIADTYNFADGLYSYWKGMMNSLGQDTTWNAAAIGGLGSIVSATPNMANIAHLFTKEGRAAYKNNFNKRPIFEDGKFKKDESGKIMTEDLGWKDNWRERINYLIQNGVLNTYYGKKANEMSLQSHANYVNNLLDEYEDFKILKDVVTADRALDAAETKGDEKTARFIKALDTMRALDKMGVESDDPLSLSSVVSDAKTEIDRIVNMDSENNENPFSEEEINKMISTYYSVNNIEENEQNNQKALEVIKKNAQELQEAKQTYDEAEEFVKAEDAKRSKPISADVRHRMKMIKALNKHWEGRIDSMRSEISDVADLDATLSDENVLPVFGGKKGTQAIFNMYNMQQKELEMEKEGAQRALKIQEEKLKETKKAFEEGKDRPDSFELGEAYTNAHFSVENIKQRIKHIEDGIQLTIEKKSQIERALQAREKEIKEGTPERVLTADEIFALDPSSRAWMMDERNRSLYTKRQQRQIEKLEEQLQKKDPDALQKIQDIALLNRRMKSNDDAYRRITKNPDAAQVMLDELNNMEATNAYRYTNQRNAEMAADYIKEAERALKGRKDVTPEFLKDFAFRTLRRLNNDLLDRIEHDGMLEDYRAELGKAKEWGKTLSDIGAIMMQSTKSEERKADLWNDIDAAVSEASDKAEVMTELEKLYLDLKEQNVDRAKDVEDVLKSLQQLGYQRDATVLESREAQKKREEEQKKRNEAAKERVEEATNKAAAETSAAKKAAERKKKYIKKTHSLNTEALSKMTFKDYIDLHPEYESEIDAESKEVFKKDPKRLQDLVEDEVNATVEYLNGNISATEYLDAVKVDYNNLEDFQIEEVAQETAKDYASYISTTEENSISKLQERLSHEILKGSKGWVTVLDEENELGDYPAIHVGTFESASDWETSKSYRLTPDGKIEYKDDKETNSEWKDGTNVEDAIKDFFAPYIKAIKNGKPIEVKGEAPPAPQAEGSEAKPAIDKGNREVHNKIVNSLRNWYRFAKEHIKFDPLSHEYYIDGQLADYSVTQYSESVFGKEEIQGDYSHSQAVGNSNDSINRDFFAGVDIMSKEYPNIKGDRKKYVLRDLQRLKEYFDKRFGVDEEGKPLYKVITTEFPIAAILSKEKKLIAGTMDMVIVDKNGGIHIFDFKTKRNSIKDYNNRRDYTAQLNLYRKILETIIPELKDKIDSLDLIWWNTDYPSLKQAEYRTDAKGNVLIRNSSTKNHASVEKVLQQAERDMRSYYKAAGLGQLQAGNAKDVPWSYYVEDESNVTTLHNGAEIINGLTWRAKIQPVIWLATSFGLIDHKYEALGLESTGPGIAATKLAREAVKDLRKNYKIKGPWELVDYIGEHLEELIAKQKEELRGFIPLSEASSFVTPYLTNGEIDDHVVIPLDKTDQIGNLTIPEMEPLASVNKQQVEEKVQDAIDNGKNAVEVEVNGVKGTAVYSDTLEQQADKIKEKTGEKPAVSSTSSVPKLDDVRDNAERSNDENPALLSGNAYSEFQEGNVGFLSRLKKLVHKIGRRGGSMEHFYKWLKNLDGGTKLQSIIDDELPEILALPEKRNMPVKFMVARSDRDTITGTGIKVSNTLMLVIDYDSKVEAIHKKHKNGGVIKLPNGKKYLLIGTVGAGDFRDPRNAARVNSYNMLWDAEGKTSESKDGIVRAKSKEFFASHKDDTFYVTDDIYTEIVPGSNTPGYIVHQLENDELPPSGFRRLSDLLSPKDGKDRNPHKLAWNNLKWMIQKKKSFINPSGADFMTLNDWEDNAGNTYLLVPAGNGRNVAIQIEARVYKEVRDNAPTSELNTKIDKLLDIIGSPTTTRNQKVGALIDLQNYINFDSKGDFIHISSDGNYISIFRQVDDMKKPPELIRSMHIKDSSYTANTFKEAFLEMNPRINITEETLSSPEKLEMYDKAGALNTDAAKLGTVGTNYSIYSVTAEGKPNKPKTLDGYWPGAREASEFRRPGMNEIPFRGHNYKELDGNYYLGTEKVEDPKIKKQLEYNLKIKQLGLEPAHSTNLYDYYIIGLGENPEVIKVKHKSYDVVVLSEAQAEKFIKERGDKIAQEQREKAAKEEMKRKKEEEEKKKKAEEKRAEDIIPDELAPNMEIMVNPDTGELMVVDMTTGEVKIVESKNPTRENKEDKKEEKQVEKKTVVPAPGKKTTGTQSFQDLITNFDYTMEILELVQSKWPEAPEDFAELEEFLIKKGVKMDAIGTTDTAIKAWLKDLKECH